ncbi:MAG: hypothetical protein COB96_07260 [Planctomycetota bacterium]|nr:MAG: hypothetical protein COB96_07260 [Planctomycetota bacterium]
MNTVTEPAKERRLHPRVQGDGLPLILREGTASLRVRDLSESGAAFYSEQPLPVMARVGFTLEFPDENGEQLRADGEGVVVRCERLSSALGHYEVSVFFQDLNPEMAKVVNAFVCRQLDAGKHA